MNIAVITTFANSHYEPFAKQMLQSFMAHWPKDISLFVQLDDDLLFPDVQSILTAQPGGEHAIAVGWDNDHAEFVARNQGRDHPTDYRMQPVRFCHKVFAIKRVLDRWIKAKANGIPVPRYLIWMDADVHTVHPVTHEALRECLPKEGDAVAYMGRKDWDHSECGWLAFDLEKGGAEIIEMMVSSYATDEIFTYPQQHDSWVFDMVCNVQKKGITNLTSSATGNEVWHQSPMGKWSVHHKGPMAKHKLNPQAVPMPMPPQVGQQGGRIQIQTKNSIPHAEIRKQIGRNQELISKWIKPCAATDEEIVVVSAGPMLVSEDVREHVEAGKKIVAVKNALTPLKAAGITPWACILLDPRPHVADFVKDADPKVLWFVASQVHPEVTLTLLARGCTVWGYHAAVNAGEEPLILKQEHAIVNGGSATATRGLYMLNHLGFSNFTLYGYDLCYPNKPDFSEVVEIIDENGVKSKHPKFLEMTLSTNDPHYNIKRVYFTEPQLWAQFEEVYDMMKATKFKIRAFGEGIVPFMFKAKRVGDMRRDDQRQKMMGDNPPTCDAMLAL